jgi:signal transduction histidine kinase
MFKSVTVERLNEIVDWFIPADIASDVEMRKQARMFLYSHIFGPYIGNTVPLALFLFDPKPGYQIGVLAAAITAFWIFPFVLRAFGHYYLLAAVSIQNLIFCILWSCFFYGGVTSPTLAWVLTIPLLALFYVGASPRMRLVALGLFGVNLGAFLYLYNVIGHPVSAMPVSAVQSLGLVSTIAASIYVAMMALFYANALASQVELEAEMREHVAKAVELRRAAKEAERAGAAKGDFLAKISHELRTPLNAVIGYSEMLLEDMSENDKHTAGDIQKIHSAGHFLLKLVNEVLDLSKIEAGKMEVHVEPVDASKLIELIGERYRPLARQNGLSLVTHCDPTIGTITTDPAKLEHALGQLIDNAIKFTSQGEVSLTAVWAENKSGEVAFSVRDTGAGIAEERFGSLFEQFNLRADTSSSKYGGTGLGLALSQKISRLLGGDISFESKLNVGTCFTIQIPIDPARAGKGGEGLEKSVDDALREAEDFHQQLRPLVIEGRREQAISDAPTSRVAAHG